MEPTPTWTDQVLTNVTSSADEVTLLLLGILGVGLGIFAIQWGVRKAIRFFKSTTN